MRFSTAPVKSYGGRSARESYGRRSLDEFELIRRFFDRPSVDDSVKLSVGDDGAVLRPADGRELVMVVDTLVENTHFTADLEARDIGYRAVAVNLSDMAAMGARPRWMTLALTLDNADENWLHEFAAGLFEAADKFGVSLVGGDTTRGATKVISIQVVGDSMPGKTIARSGAAPGDAIFVSGTIGDAAAGLAQMLGKDENPSGSGFLKRRFSRPTPRLSLGQALVDTASAAIDVSDGLYSDIVKLLARSDMGGTLVIDAIPLSEELQSLGRDTALRFALGGGDDYELCFTASPGDQASIAGISGNLGLPITRIGSIHDGKQLNCTLHGAAFDFADAGFRHF